MADLYEVAILEAATKKQAEDGKMDRLVLGPIAVIAASEQTAAVAAVMNATKEQGIELDQSRMIVLVRPFVQSR